MPLNTNFNVGPYFDDYDEDKNFHRVIFKASMPIQARELTQLQTILQNQIERFGENILREGSIVKGGNFFDMKKFPFVKISDNNINNQPIIIGNYAGTKVTGRNSGVTGVVITYSGGLETQSPDLNTLYVKYTGTGINGANQDVKTFIPGEILEFTINGNIIPELSVSVVTFGIDPNPTGNAYLVSCGDGVIFQKGFFVGFDNQIIPVSKYSTYPDKVVVGFVTEEVIVDSKNDTSLLDNANGFNNFNAPGADRLKLVPRLVVYSTIQAAADERFFAIQEYQNGNLVRRNVTTQFNSVEKLVEKRTSEESGNYNVRGMKASIRNDNLDPTKLNVYVSEGLSYVEGKRVETVGETGIRLDKGEEFGTVYQQNILANYGNYVVIEGVKGSFDFNTMGKVNLYDVAQVATSTVAFTAAGTKIGEARVRSFTRDSSTTMRLYLFDFRMLPGKAFVNSKSITMGSTAFANIKLESGSAVLKDSSFKSIVFSPGKTSIKEIVSSDTDYSARRYVETSASSAGILTVTLSGNETFPQGAGATLNSDARSSIIVTNISNGLVYPLVGATVGGGGNTLTIDIGSLGSVTNVGVSFNVKISNVLPIGKELKTVYMRINPNSYTNGPYHLGWPDVYSIEGVWKHNDLVFTESTPGITDVTLNFILNQNTNQDFYDISYLTPKNITITNSDRFLVKAKVLAKTVTGGYSQSFFTVNSYPIDDTAAVLPTGKMRTEDIPNGLRDVIDFRPHAQNNAVFAETAAAASIFTSANKLDNVSFGTLNLNMIAPNESVETTYSYYMGRRDRLVVSENGSFEIMRGTASDNPTTPAEPVKGMTIALIDIAPFPTLSPAKANRIGKPEHAAVASASMNPRYTMKDIKGIDDRIKRIEYYTALNSLEKSAEDLNIKDANGFNRFKNGIIADNFSDLLLCDVVDDDFKASVDRSESSMSPRQRSYNIPLQVSLLNSTVMSSDGVVTLPYVNQQIINQRYASKYRNCVTDFYSYIGSTKLIPEYDGTFDTTFAPDVAIDIDISGAFTGFTKALNEIVPMRTSTTNNSSRIIGQTSQLSSVNVGSGIRNTTTTTRTTQRTATTNTEELVQNDLTNTQKVGDFITDISFSPYLRENTIEVSTAGLRPNTQFYVFFDSIQMTQNVAAAAKIGTSTRRLSSFGSILRSDQNGSLLFLLKIPGQTFYVGDREILIMDVPDISSRVAATSVSTATYRGFNFSVEKTGVEVSTRMPDFNVQRSISIINTVVNATTVTNNFIPSPTFPFVNSNDDDGPRSDPIAQTFMISSAMSNDGTVFVSKVSAAFFKKSQTNGVTLEIRTVDNGYPSQKTVPFGRVKKAASDISTSVDGSISTEFVFNSLVSLKTGTEYAMVIIPDGNDPDYLIWISKTGMNDVQTGTKVVMDANPGTLFTSTNNRAWTAYQDENLKFSVTKANFTAGEGTVMMSNSNMEFFNLGAFSGNFERGEKAYITSAVDAPGTISTIVGSNIITGVGTTFNVTFAIGRYIAIRNTVTNKYVVAKITEISSSTSMTIDEYMDVTQNTRTYYKTKVGVVDYFISTTPAMLFLKDSSAISGDVFIAGSTIIGEDSYAAATIQSVMNLPISFIQPDIYRTNFPKTSTKLHITKQTTESISSISRIPISFGEDNHLRSLPTVIKSRTNEIISDSGLKSLNIEVGLSSLSSGTNRNTSPTVDTEISSINVVQYFVNIVDDGVLVSEAFSNGTAEAKIISKKISLADGMDAEDFKVLLTAYKPGSTTIDVFVKFRANEDFDNWDKTPWTKLNLEAKTNFVSSTANRFDFKEFEFCLTDIVVGNGEGAYLTNDGFMYKSESGAQYTNFKYVQIKIVMGSSSHNVIPRVKDMRAIALT